MRDRDVRKILCDWCGSDCTIFAIDNGYQYICNNCLEENEEELFGDDYCGSDLVTIEERNR